MIGSIIVFLINVLRLLRNGWRMLWRRRVDYVKITLRGALPEFATTVPWWRKRFLGAREPVSLSALRRQLFQIGDDPHARGILLEINGLAAGWATLQSLRAELLRFRARGKRVVVYAYTLDNAGYFAASAADEIITPPTAGFSVIGLFSEVQYFKDALAKWGITAEVEAVSPYKSAYENVVRSDMSAENREQLDRLLDERFNTLVQAIAEGRGIGADAVRALIDRAPLSGREAQTSGLIDALLYEDQLEAQLKHGEQAPIIREWEVARKALRLPYVRRQRKLIGVVPIEGTIVSGGSRTVPLPLPLIGGAQVGADNVAQAIRAAERNKRIAGVVIFVNSPGGDAFASDLMWREVLRLRTQKPVVVVMGDVAASGGYYLAAPASTIIAQPGTITGSIGVISLRPVLAGLLAKADIHTTTLSRGANSGLLATSQPLSDAERATWRRLIGETYQEFKDRVSSGRGIAEHDLEPIAGGRVWTGTDAHALRLIDAFGGTPEGVRRARELAALPADERAPLVLLRGGRSETPPLPFPDAALATLLASADDLLRPRIWAILPFVGL